MLSGPLKIVICLVFFLLNFFFYCLKLSCMKIYKHAFLQINHPCFTQDLGPLCPSSHQLQSPGPGLQRPWQVAPKQDLVNTLGKQTEWLLGPEEVSKCGVIGQTAGKPHHFSTFLHQLFKVQGLSGLRQWVEACLQWLNIIPGSPMKAVLI